MVPLKVLHGGVRDGWKVRVMCGVSVTVWCVSVLYSSVWLLHVTGDVRGALSIMPLIPTTAKFAEGGFKQTPISTGEDSTVREATGSQGELPGCQECGEPPGPQEGGEPSGNVRGWGRGKRRRKNQQQWSRSKMRKKVWVRCTPSWLGLLLPIAASVFLSPPLSLSLSLSTRHCVCICTGQCCLEWSTGTEANTSGEGNFIQVHSETHSNVTAPYCSCWLQKSVESKTPSSSAFVTS